MFPCERELGNRGSAEEGDGEGGQQHVNGRIMWSMFRPTLTIIQRIRVQQWPVPTRTATLQSPQPTVNKPHRIADIVIKYRSVANSIIKTPFP